MSQDYAGQLASLALTGDLARTLMVILCASGRSITGDPWYDLVVGALQMNGPARYRGVKIHNFGTKILKESTCADVAKHKLQRHLSRSGACEVLNDMARGVITVVTGYDRTVPAGMLTLCTAATQRTEAKARCGASWDASTAVFHHRGTSTAPEEPCVSWPTGIAVDPSWVDLQQADIDSMQAAKEERQRARAARLVEIDASEQRGVPENKVKTTDIRALTRLTANAIIICIRQICATNGFMVSAAAACQHAADTHPPGWCDGDAPYLRRHYFTPDAGLWPNED